MRLYNQTCPHNFQSLRGNAQLFQTKAAADTIPPVRSNRACSDALYKLIHSISVHTDLTDEQLTLQGATFTPS